VSLKPPALLIKDYSMLLYVVRQPLVYAHPRRDGQAELTWVGGNIPRRYVRYVAHSSTNRARRV